MINTIMITLNENTRDEVNAVLVHGNTTNIITELPSISKPYDKKDYTFEWKQGLFSWYQSIVKELLGYDAITVEIDYTTYCQLMQLA
mgnify:CR=1 FL=1